MAFLSDSGLFLKIEMLQTTPEGDSLQEGMFQFSFKKHIHFPTILIGIQRTPQKNTELKESYRNYKNSCRLNRNTVCCREKSKNIQNAYLSYVYILKYNYI